MKNNEILMPALSPTMEEGTLAKWLVKVGDKISSGDLIAEIETDKATMEIEAIEEGFISKLIVEEGAQGIKINTPIAEFSDTQKFSEINDDDATEAGLELLVQDLQVEDANEINYEEEEEDEEEIEDEKEKNKSSRYSRHKKNTPNIPFDLANY